MADGSAPRTRATGIRPCHAVTARCGETQAQRQGETCVQRRTSAGFIAAVADVYRHRYSYSAYSHPAAKSELVQHVQISASLMNSDAIRPSSRRRSWSVPLGKTAKPSLHVGIALAGVLTNLGQIAGGRTRRVRPPSRVARASDRPSRALVFRRREPRARRGSPTSRPSRIAY